MWHSKIARFKDTKGDNHEVAVSITLLKCIFVNIIVAISFDAKSFKTNL